MTSETRPGYYWAICQHPWGIVSQSPTWLPTPHACLQDPSGKRAAPRLLALECCYGRGPARTALGFHCSLVESLRSLFRSNKDVFVEHLARYTVPSAALWMHRGGIVFMCRVLQGRGGCAGEGRGPGGRGSGSFFFFFVKTTS